MFSEDYRRGKELEDLVEEEFENYKINFRKVDDLEEQHKGDFYLTKAGFYVECKADFVAFSSTKRRTPNLYFEVGKIYDETFSKKKETIEVTGVLKNSSMAPTIFISQVAQDEFMVFSGEAMAEWWLKKPSCVFYSISTDPDYKGKTMLGMVIKDWRENRAKLMSFAKFCSRATLVRTVGSLLRSLDGSKLLPKDTFISLTKKYGKYRFLPSYEILNHGNLIRKSPITSLDDDDDEFWYDFFSERKA